MLPVALSNLARLASQSAFVSDFDGTLAPIVDDPATATPLPQAIHALQTLAARLGLVAIVSGRPIAFLREHVAVERVVLVGHYGLERLVDGQVVLDPRAEPYVDAVAAAAADAQRRWPSLIVERKGDIAFTVHWRNAPASEPSADDLASLAEQHGLQTQPGRMACELRPPVPVDKGTVFEELAHDFRHSAFAGDDHGDLAAFNVGVDAPDDDGRIVRIAVRSPEAPRELLERADLVVDGPEGLAALLSDLADALSSCAQP